MGVEGLYKFINKNCPNVYDTQNIYNIRGKSCIIDGMQHIYSQLIYMRSRQKEVITIDGKNISHIYGLLNSLTYYLKFNIIPIFIFDGKSPDIKKKKIDERRANLKENLKKLKDLENKKKNISDIINLKMHTIENNYSITYGTPPEVFNFEASMEIMTNIQEEYQKIYRRSIVLKDYYIIDWIEILELLGLPVIKAEGEADPLCSYILKNNSNIYGIISDDSDMLIFGATVLMRKSINQQFTIIELEKLLEELNILLKNDYDDVNFTMNNLIEFSILLGTDYGSFTLDKTFNDSLELLKYYVDHNMDVKKILNETEILEFNLIKNYYVNNSFDESYNYLLEKPIWHKPNLLALKKRLLELYVDEDYIDKTFEILDTYFNKIKKNYYYRNNFNFVKYKPFERRNTYDRQPIVVHPIINNILSSNLINNNTNNNTNNI